MATYAKILKDPSGNQILPYTRDNLVYSGSSPLSSIIKHLYHGNCAVSSWKNTSTNGYSFYIDMPFSADNGGKTDLNSAKIMNPMSIKTGTASTDKTIQKTLNIIADGFMECTTDGILRIYTKEQPSSDITIYFEAQY